MSSRIHVRSISPALAGADLHGALRAVGDDPDITSYDGLLDAAKELDAEVEDIGDRDDAASLLVKERLRLRGFGVFDVSAKAPEFEPKYVISAFALHGSGGWLGACCLGDAGEAFAVHHPPPGSDRPAMRATVFDTYEKAKAELESNFDDAVNWKSDSAPEVKAYFALEHLRPVPA